MKPVECEFESEVLAAVVQSRWPERVDVHLRAHVGSCSICSDITTVAGALDEAREEMRSQAVVPESGRVWWLAQVRSRREAAAAAGRPITAAQVIAFICAVVLLGACFGATSTWFQTALKGMISAVAGFRLQVLPSATALIAEHGAVVLTMAAVLLLVPAAVYLAMLRD
jgi:hypothetical protein